jgi:hypothetical protein
MFALPVLAAYLPAGDATLGRVRVPGRVWLVAVLVAVALWQPPVLVGDLGDAGNPTAARSYFAPLIAELDRRRPAGRIEIPPTRDYWEAAHAVTAAPLARGWLRQVDIDRNPLFFDGTLTADTYRDWLLDNGVRYVAVADAEPSWVGRKEAEIVRAGQPYLTEVWRGGHWALYEVAGQPSIADGATVVAATGDRVTLDVPAAGDYTVRVRWSRWLDVTGPAGARIERHGRWSSLRVTAPGRYTVSG